VRYCCAINGTLSPADIDRVVGTVPLLIAQISFDITEEETKSPRIQQPRRTPQRMTKNNKSPTRPRRNHDSLRIPQNRKATRTEYNNKRNAK
jgi:hypothetical protein